jgi:hypothetical protein
MPAINEDLWPELNLAATTTPLSILREQAALLGKRTKGVLRGEVETWGIEERIAHSFSIAVPSLGDYKYNLFLIQHLPIGYPVYVTHWATSMRGHFSEVETRSGEKTLADEGELRDWLRLTFHSDEVKRIVENLYAQAST